MTAPEREVELRFQLRVRVAELEDRVAELEALLDIADFNAAHLGRILTAAMNLSKAETYRCIDAAEHDLRNYDAARAAVHERSQP
jgi:hypothetical protein